MAGKFPKLEKKCARFCQFRIPSVVGRLGSRRFRRRTIPATRNFRTPSSRTDSRTSSSKPSESALTVSYAFIGPGPTLPPPHAAEYDKHNNITDTQTLVPGSHSRLTNDPTPCGFAHLGGDGVISHAS
ncbi:hypothetical protein L1887_62865 [Cichorium endivia]|nr:hypothetical protein L1887_62865 [Cichorium endivia]